MAGMWACFGESRSACSARFTLPMTILGGTTMNCLRLMPAGCRRHCATLPSERFVQFRNFGYAHTPPRKTRDGLLARDGKGPEHLCRCAHASKVGIRTAIVKHGGRQQAGHRIDGCEERDGRLHIQNGPRRTRGIVRRFASFGR